MEASMLVAPKPSLLVSPARGGSSTRWCIVAAAAGRRKNQPETRRPEGGRSGGAPSKQLAAAAAAMSSATALPCHAAEPTQLHYGAAMMVLGDLDPATAKVVIGVAGPALSALGFLFIARIVMSWYPRLPVTKFPYVVAYAPTEPILAATRKVIPPLGGVDVTPVVWFGLVSFLSEILVGPQGLLVLLSQQVSK
ncbi:hypothetical protein QYE76_017848 [Lolium multiflorum]|uniref:Protein COFACTOR ASSEMBLY OF COMPLEX C SUBUNIT B CCB3, chloroplastic n=1 Tax=Lolium multiflorum TaxID=4521 RepID=A0AAD8VA44_LOLMU|nr:hypothetical protein QYE76_017848 [Lolium multiflorum]